jgi:hypothetical protein
MNPLRIATITNVGCCRCCTEYQIGKFKHPSNEICSGYWLNCATFAHAEDEPLAVLQIGDRVRLIFSWDGGFFRRGKRRYRTWSFTWEPVWIDHEDMYGSGYEGYED